MTSLPLAVRDSTTMLRRNLLHARRYPSMTFGLIAIPVVFLLLYVYVFGNALASGLGDGRAAYTSYITPTILMIAVGSSATGTAVSVAMDMTEGIIARFRTMAIFRPSVLTGHVLGAVVQITLGLAALIPVALLVGFRSPATALEWLAAVGLLLLAATAVTWFGVGCGLAAKTVESASNMPMPLILLPFLGSGFVPTATMPTVVRWFAAYQPFTPIMETLRGLLLGTGIGRNGWLAVAWCVVIGVGSFLWARRSYARRDR
jgi:ABC-2 type transport system permease protein